ncbi:endonuclease/exonuclease/phosphatase family protein [Sphaerotilus sp.]|uniref:endonuclease/exonuclease/phosphatase family protein n=1 Tax=Sphaerotilus sp. TaxID=2093942 RepID=UPI002ACE535E|nr:endonuclease/exonuclease/phosphatase family protein [Sphaerotilus sp.]MDZ7854957.1 endonuclease/exonuclease/phosphatase family protein [Sphaerotilus sp.]
MNEVSTPPDWATVQVASCNLLNLALPGRVFYPNQEPYGASEHERKLDWLGGMFRRLNADVIGVQEVWDEAALKAAVARSGLRPPKVLVPGAESGAEGTPRVGLVTRLEVESVRSVADFAPGEAVEVPEIGLHTRFERPVLHAVLRTKRGQRLHVLVTHLKSKRPKFLQDAAGTELEDRDDPRVVARASLRSLILRGAESAALRGLVTDLIHRTRDPLVLLGDMNDGPQSVTSQLIAATQAVAYDRKARDVALFHAYDVQSEPALRRDLAYSHVFQGWPDLLDQIWVSEELVGSAKFAIGDVRRVEYFNDHLHEGRDRTRSDHGFVRALLRFKSPPLSLPLRQAEQPAAQQEP